MSFKEESPIGRVNRGFELIYQSQGGKMKIYKLLVIPILLIGCATIRTGPSQTAQSFEGKISRLLIVFNSTPLGREASRIKDEEFDKLIIPFREVNLEAESFCYNDLDIDASTNLETKSQKYEYTLLIQPIHMMRGDVQINTYNLHIIENKSQRKIWVSQIEVPGIPLLGMGVYRRFEEMGQKIVENMSADGLMSTE